MKKELSSSLKPLPQGSEVQNNECKEKKQRKLQLLLSAFFGRYIVPVSINYKKFVASLKHASLSLSRIKTLTNFTTEAFLINSRFNIQEDNFILKE